MTDNKSAAVHQEPVAQVSIQTMERAADAMAKSGFYGIKTKEEGLALMLVGQADGIHFAAAVRDYHIIQGRPAMKADAMLARFQKSGGKVEWIKLTDAEVSAKFSHPQGGSAVITWDEARVAMADLKNPMHKKYPRAMKRSRVVSEGVRTVFPGAIGSAYSVEEMQDLAYEETARTQVSEPAQLAAPLGKVEGESGTGLTDSEIEDHNQALKTATDEEGLRAAFKTAWKHGTEAKDETAKRFFKTIYEEQKLAHGFA